MLTVYSILVARERPSWSTFSLMFIVSRDLHGWTWVPCMVFRWMFLFYFLIHVFAKYFKFKHELKNTRDLCSIH